MSQHDYNVADASGATVRADLNNALQAIVTLNSGAAEPSTMFAGQWWHDTATATLKRRNAANAAWITIGPIDQPLLAATEVLAGIAEKASQAKTDTGTDDERFITPLKLRNTPPPGSIPSGSVMPYAGSTEPGGWLYCAGQAVSRATYATLFAAISTVYGAGDGSTTFNLPDIRGRAAVGRDNMNGADANRVTTAGSGIDGNALAAAGGSETHTLTTAQMPAHTHTAGDALNTPGTAGGGNPRSTGVGTVVTGSTGGGGAHQNMPPALILNYIIKT